MKRIKYLSYYIQDGDNEDRVCALSAKTKMDYICSVMNKNGFFVEIISASQTRSKKHCFKGRTIRLNEMQSLKTFFTFPAGNILKRALRWFSSNLFVFLELMKLKKDEKVLVYHSLGYMKMVNLVHRIKKFQLILEVEEIYADVIGEKSLKEKEIHFIKSAERYIFATELLDQYVNGGKKTSLVIYGTYHVEAEENYGIKEEVVQDRNREIVNCVYAGTLDPRKGGAYAAVNAAIFLPSNYHVHILGFGTKLETENLKELIEKVKEKAKARITYDGILSGSDYIKFIKNCNIGLSTQNPDADFNATSFPSKILSYMSNSLRVVCIRIPAVEASAVNDYVYYYDEQTPENIAHTIMEIDLNDNYDSKKIIDELDLKFQKELKIFLEA